MTDQELDPRFNSLLQKFIREELTPPELNTFLELAKIPGNQLAIRDAIGHFLDAETYANLAEGMDIDEQFIQAMKRAKNEISLPEASGSEHMPGAVQHMPGAVQRIPGARKRILSGENSLASPRRRPSIYKRWWAAAAVILILITGTWFWSRTRERDKPIALHQPIDVAPGKSGAILVLADNTRVELDTMGNGVVATQNGVQAILQNGRLAYETNGKTGVTGYNTMSTPKGRQFQLQLPDGTKVWLNAASSIRYPTAFAGRERRVEVTGEAYFEVATNAKMPFLVEAGDMGEIEVLGTNFNINAYKKENGVRTTLLEGRVKVMGGKDNGGSVILEPGQQAVIHPDNLSGAQVSQAGSLVSKQAVDIDQVMAWKNGFFNFGEMSIREAMDQIERWYDITVVYEKGVPDIQFFGEISRNVNLSDLIAALKDVGVHFRLEEGRKLVVMP